MQEFETGLATESPDAESGCGCAIAEAADDGLLNTAAFEELYDQQDLDESEEPAEDAEEDLETDDGSVDADERSAQAQGKVKGLFQKLKDACGHLFGKSNSIGEAVQQICDWAESTVCKAVDWWIQHDGTEEEKHPEIEAVQDLIGDIFLQAAEDTSDTAERTEKKNQESSKSRSDSMEEMLETERQLERDRRHESPFFDEAAELDEDVTARSSGGVVVELVTMGDDLYRVSYIEDADGHRTLQSMEVVLDAPDRTPELEPIPN